MFSEKSKIILRFIIYEDNFMLYVTPSIVSYIILVLSNLVVLRQYAFYTYYGTQKKNTKFGNIYIYKQITKNVFFLCTIELNVYPFILITISPFTFFA